METNSIRDRHETFTGSNGEAVRHPTGSAASTIEAPELPLNPEALARTMELSPKTVLELLHLFVSSSLRDLSQIEEAIRSGDLNQVMEAAHSLKGAALSFDFTDISAAASSLEISARSRSLSGEADAVPFIKRRLEAIARSIVTGEKQPS